MRLTEASRDLILQRLRPFSPKAIYLFGSFGTSRQHPGSDIDLAILPAEPADSVSLFQIANELSSSLGREVDLIDLTKATTVMAKEVLRTGDRLAADDLSAARNFEMRTLSDYARLNEERHPILEAILSIRKQKSNHRFLGFHGF